MEKEPTATEFCIEIEFLEYKNKTKIHALKMQVNTKYKINAN